MTASWAGLGLGKPSGKGNLNGVAATRAAGMERASMMDEEKCMVSECQDERADGNWSIICRDPIGCVRENETRRMVCMCV